jgi:hypothetical protein
MRLPLSKRPFIRLAIALVMAGPLATAVNAQIFPGAEPVPDLLRYASETPMQFSSASASSDYIGSQRAETCSSSWAFWECREWLDAGDSRDPNNTSKASSDTGALVEADRRGNVFGPRLDNSHAESWARARTDFGANRAEAHAWNSGSWIERRVEGAWDPTVTEEEGFSQASAGATSLYVESFTADVSGVITLDFAFRQHPGSSPPAYSGFPLDSLEGDADGFLLVQVFDLDQPWVYYQPGGEDGDPPVEGPRIIGDLRERRDGIEGAGTTWLSLTLDLTAGHRYSLVSRLDVDAWRNGSADFYGTAELERILVAPDQTLSFASGTVYNVAVVPEPGAAALLLAGLGVLALRARRQKL